MMLVHENRTSGLTRMKLNDNEHQKKSEKYQTCEHKGLQKLRFGLVSFGLCCLMTPGLSKDIRCHV